MRTLLLIVYLLFLSCDSSELFGVHELDDTTLDYYDYLSRGWQAIFDDDYELAKSDFNQATLLDSVDNKNSAYVGLGWAATFSANEFFSSTECSSSDAIECVDVINNLRLDASEYFELATESCLNSLGETMPGWICTTCCLALDPDATDAECAAAASASCLDDDEYNYSNIASAVDEYTTECADNYVNCFEEFNKDLEIGKLYLELLEFDMEDHNLSDLGGLEDIIIKFEQFLLYYPDYDIASNKPPYLSTFNFNYQDIATLLSQLLLRVGNGNDCAAEYYLQVNDVCEDYSLGSDRLYSFFGDTENNIIVGGCGKLTEIKFNTGYFRTLIDFMFYDTDDNIINVNYYDNGDDPDDEIKDGCNLPAYTIAYVNADPDYIIYNIPDDIKEFKLKFDTYLTDGEEFSGHNPNFDYIHGCYNPYAADECLCDDVDEILIFQCIQTNL